jgi:hypothetical protein
MYDWVCNAAGSTTPQIQQGSLSSTESSNENSSFSVSIVGTCFDGPGCRQCNRRHIQGFRVEYVVVCARKNNKYVETEMGIVKKAFWAVACSNFIVYLYDWHFC